MSTARRSTGERADLRKERHGTTCCLNARGDDHPDADVGHIREPDCCGPSRRVLVRRAVPGAGRGSAAGARSGDRPARGARRRAGRDRGGRPSPSARWKVRYGLMLGLERVLTEDPARTAAGTELRRHQIDALTGMLAELIASNAALRRGERQRQRVQRRRRRGRGRSTRPTTTRTRASSTTSSIEEEFVGTDPGAIRRYRFRHPTASGKTIAAAGFVEAARHLGVLILTHRRLLVAQFKRDLTTEGYGDRFVDRDRSRARSRRATTPITIQTYAWFARHGDGARSQRRTTS